MSRKAKRQQLDLFSQPAPTAPYQVVEKRQYLNGKWDDQYCLRYYSEPDLHPHSSDCKKVFHKLSEAKAYAHANKLEFRLKPISK